MRYLLDTHILLWWYLDSPELPPHYAALLDEVEQGGEETLGLSVISLWEIAKLVSLGKFKVSFSLDQWFEDLAEEFEILPLNGALILESTRLGPGFHKDPADQLIVATARHHGLRLLTVDEKIINSGRVAVA